MKHLKPYNESSKITDYKFNKFYKSVQLIFSELIDSKDVDIWKHSDEHNFDPTLGEFVKIHIPVPLSVSSADSGEPDKFENYINSINQWNELLKDIDISLKRIKEDFPNSTYHFDFGGDYLELIFSSWD